MYYYDLHCHTSLSKDSPAKIHKVVALAKKRGLDGIAITNHNKTYKGELEIDGIQIIPGNEVTIKEGHHLLAFFVEEDIKPRMEINETILEIKRQGGYAVLAHPYRDGNGWIKRRIKKGEDIHRTLSLLDGIESGNGSDSKKEREFAAKIAEEANLIQIAGSDLHMSGQVGLSVIEVKEKINKENFKEVIRESRIIRRPEADIIFSEWRCKKIFLEFCRLMRFYKRKHISNIFFWMIVRNYFRIRNIKFKKIEFDYKQK